MDHLHQILDVLHMDEYEETEPVREPVDLEAVLKELMDYAHETGVMPEDNLTYRDLFDTRLMNCLMPRPVEVVHIFWKKPCTEGTWDIRSVWQAWRRQWPWDPFPAWTG